MGDSGGQPAFRRLAPRRRGRATEVFIRVYVGCDGRLRKERG
jgi:hypothetical protein